MNRVFKIDSASCLRQFRSIIKFSVVGVMNTAVDFGIFGFLYSGLGVHYLVSQAIAYSLAVCNSFVFNKTWTFQYQYKDISNQLSKFVFVNIVSLLMSLLGLRFLNGYGGMNVYFAKICVVIITQIVNYCGYRYWVFRNKRPYKQNTKLPFYQ